MLAAGFSDSLLRVWPLNISKLRNIKHPEDLNIFDKETDDVLENTMDDNSASDSKQLLGHSGPVYCTVPHSLQIRVISFHRQKMVLFAYGACTPGQIS